MKKVFLSLLLIGLAIVAYRLIPTINGDDEGVVSFKVMDESSTLIESELTFDETMTLFELLDEYYDIKCANNNYGIDDNCQERPMGRVILVIEDIETDWTSSFFQIRINGEPSNYGVDSIEVNDGDDIVFMIQTPW